MSNPVSDFSLGSSSIRQLFFYQDFPYKLFAPRSALGKD